MHSQLFSEMGKSILGAAALGIPAYYLKVPLILAYLAAGVILGPHVGFGVIRDSENIATLSEIGLVLLMYILGLEIDLRKLLQAGKAVLVNGITQVFGCVALGLVYFKVLGYSHTPYELFYLAFACSLSSTLIVVKILSDQMDLDALPSRITLGVLVLQDLWVIAFLAVQPNLSDLNSMALLQSFSKVGVLVASGWFIARFVLPRLFFAIGKQPELMLIVAMAWCFGMCGLANVLNLSLEMGALVAGVSIASFPYHIDVAAKIASLRDFFITLFFVSLGLQVPIPSVYVFGLALAIIAFVMLSRVITVFPVLHKMKYGNRASLLPSLNLSQVSEFSLVLAALGVSYGHVRGEILAALIIAMVFTSLMSSFLIPGGHALYLRLNPFLEILGFADHVGSQKETETPKKHPTIVLLGFYREASSLLYEMQKRYSESAMENILVVDFNPEAHHALRELGIQCKYGDISNIDTLKQVGMEHAKLIVCTIPDQVLKGISNLKLLLLLKKLAPQASIIVSAEKLKVAQEMYDAGADYVFVPRLVSAYYLVDVLERIQTEGAKSLREGGIGFLQGRQEVVP